MFLWIWNIKDIGTPQEIINKLKTLNCNNVCIKYHDGSMALDFEDDFLEYMPILKAAGIKVGAWGYNYFNYPDAEASLIRCALFNGADYYIFDGEEEIEGKSDQTENVLQQVRSAYPTANLGYAPFPYIKYHLNYPYKIFDKYCNFATPQSYSVAIGTSLDNCLKTTIQYFQETALNLPIYPSIEAYKVEYYSPIKSFTNYGIWDLDSMDDGCAAFLAGQSDPAVTLKPKPKENENIRQLQSNLSLLHIADLVVDGIQGPLTTAAIKRFQTIMGLTIDGIVGPQTQGAISRILSRITISYGSKDIVVRYIQWAVGDPVIDGDYGPNTMKYIKSFQFYHELVQDGIVGPKTWTQLI